MFNVPQSSTPPDDFDDNENFEPISQARIGGNLRNLENFLIKGDLRRCVICNSEYSHGDGGCGSNLPRVLYCGCCMCEGCIAKHILKVSITDKHQSGAACQVTCPICCVKHVFKLTKSGFLICNDRYIKVQDERGLVNYFPENKINPNYSTSQIFGGTI